jgi:phosphoribosylanthranilate isomerase
MIENLRRTLIPDIAPGIRIIKALSVATAMMWRDTRSTRAWQTSFSSNQMPHGGGSGERFDWSVLEAYDGTTPFLLSGGIGRTMRSVCAPSVTPGLSV